jgi:hypothetical protein
MPIIYGGGGGGGGGGNVTISTPPIITSPYYNGTSGPNAINVPVLVIAGAYRIRQINVICNSTGSFLQVYDLASIPTVQAGTATTLWEEVIPAGTPAVLDFDEGPDAWENVTTGIVIAVSSTSAGAGPPCWTVCSDPATTVIRVSYRTPT